MKNIAKALVEAQKNFAPALKQTTNPFFNSKYVDLAGCVEAVIDALHDQGIMLMQPCHECDDGVLVETLFIHESGEQLSAGKLHVPASKKDPQGYGSALTYARRYSLMSACGIAPEDDDGNAASQSTQKENPSEKDKVKYISEAQGKKLSYECSQAGIKTGKLAEHFKISKLSEIRADQMAEALTFIESCKQTPATDEPF